MYAPSRAESDSKCAIFQGGCREWARGGFPALGEGVLRGGHHDDQVGAYNQQEQQITITTSGSTPRSLLTGSCTGRTGETADYCH